MKTSNYFFFLLFVCQISLRAQLVANAGTDQTICPGISVGIGSAPTASGGIAPYKYLWSPNSNISNDTVSNPTVYPNSTTTYTVIVTDAHGAIGTDNITIFVYDAHLWAGNDTTIPQGQTITLHGQASTGYYNVSWSTSDPNIYHSNTLMPDVFPNTTATYTLIAHFPNGCTEKDYLTIHVTPSSNLVFYNTFTPNGDGSNDLFYIGNLEKYPDSVLEIYNRYGQKVFNKTGYSNDWDGKYLNAELPAGTYYYILDTKSSSGGKHKGSVTIIR